jgi:hypothetical protein
MYLVPLRRNTPLIERPSAANLWPIAQGADLGFNGPKTRTSPY